MKQIEVLTLFPELFASFLTEGLIGKAISRGLIEIVPVNFREYGLGRHKKVDEEPYGGGAGMVLRPEPLFAAVRERELLRQQAGGKLWKILLSPQGQPFNQEMAVQLAERPEGLLFICGRYEGFDERIRQGLPDEEISLGDFVMMGGETAALAIIESVARLIPGVLGNPESGQEESFAAGRLEYPQYTRPPEFEGMTVPKVLLSGNHGEISRWRTEQAEKRTARRRPDLMAAKRRHEI